jgi:cytochrome c556
MDWKPDRLIESTMALANDVKRQPISNLPAAIRTAEQALADTSKQIPLPSTFTPMTWAASERDEILQRVNNFKAHQQKVAQEREDYYLQIKAKMTAPAAFISQKKNPPA